jgi:aspartate carbamoyltransferase catalytic subunit
MIPMGIEKMGCTVSPTMETCIEGADVVMMLRIQKERQGNILFPSEREYATLFGLNRTRLGLAREDVLIMHPGPMNRGVEISSDVADSGGSIILEQVTNGVALRMALFYLVAGGGRHADSH